MEKIINVKVLGSEIEQSSGFGGIQGESGARCLKISFDDEWSAYSKSVTFLDANLANPVKVYLTTAIKNADGTYNVTIPSEPLKTGGKLTYIIDGSCDGTIQRSVKKELKVKYAPIIDSASDPLAPTPAQADQLNLSILEESKRIDALETKAESASEDVAELLSRVNINENTLIKKADISYVDMKVPLKASEDQATEGTNDTEFMTPLMGKKQFDRLFSASYVKAPEIYTKESIEGMKAITGMRGGDMCMIISGTSSAQSIYRYFTKDINGAELSNPQWVWLTDLSLFAPLPVLDLTDGMWDYALGNSAKITLTADTILNISNVYSGSYGVLDVYGAYTLTLPENSYSFPPDWDYLVPNENQHWRLSFYYDGSKFDWSRSVRENG